MSSLDGWDIVFVADTDVFNGPDGFMKIDPIPLKRKNGNIVLDAMIDGMKIVPGGSGRIIFIELRFASGGVNDDGTEIDLSDATVSAQLIMSFHTPPKNAKVTLVANNMKARNLSAQENGQITCVKHLKLKKGDPLGPFEATDVNAIVENALEKSTTNFAHKIGELATFLGTSKINKYSYVTLYIDGKNGEPGRIAILSLFEGSSGSDLPTTEAALKIPEAAQVDGVELLTAFTLPAFANHILIPALASQFSLNTSDFSVGDDGSISSQAKVKLKTIEKDDMDFTPEITSFTCTPDSGQLKVEVDGTCPLKAGMSLSFKAKMRIGISIDSSSGEISFDVIGKPKMSTDTHLSWYDYAIAFASISLSWLLPAIGAALVYYVKNSVEDTVTDTTSSQITPNQIANLVHWNLPLETKRVTVELDGEKESKEVTSHVTYRDVTLANVFRIDAQSLNNSELICNKGARIRLG